MFKTSILIGAALFSSLTLADGYADLSVGRTDLDISGVDDSTSVGFKAGYKLNERFALELGYTDFGDSDVKGVTGAEVKADGFNVSGVATIPVNNTVDVFGKVGILFWDAQIDYNGRELADDSGEDVLVGLGVTAKLAPNFSLVGEYQYVDIDDSDVTNLSVGARYHF